MHTSNDKLTATIFVFVFMTEGYVLVRFLLLVRSSSSCNVVLQSMSRLFFVLFLHFVSEIGCLSSYNVADPAEC